MQWTTSLCFCPYWWSVKKSITPAKRVRDANTILLLSIQYHALESVSLFLHANQSNKQTIFSLTVVECDFGIAKVFSIAEELEICSVLSLRKSWNTFRYESYGVLLVRWLCWKCACLTIWVLNKQISLKIKSRTNYIWKFKTEFLLSMV